MLWKKRYLQDQPASPSRISHSFSDPVTLLPIFLYSGLNWASLQKDKRSHPLLHRHAYLQKLHPTFTAYLQFQIPEDASAVGSSPSSSIPLPWFLFNSIMYALSRSFTASSLFSSSNPEVDCKRAHVEMHKKESSRRVSVSSVVHHAFNYITLILRHQEASKFPF